MFFSRKKRFQSAAKNLSYDPDKNPEYNNPVLTADCCLLVFDIHQDIEWLQRILKKEEGRFSHIILGGDYFDPRKGSGRVNAVEACDFYLDLKKQYGNAVTFLLGNHDLPYLEYFGRLHKKESTEELIHLCSGFSRDRAEILAGKLDWSFWHECRLFKFANRHLISHAGVAGAYWPEPENGTDPLILLEAQSREALLNAHRESHPLFNCGFCRGGLAPKGGICWHDFRHEFCDEDIPHPQLVGHTSSIRGPRQNGRSWCLDGRQNCYALLEKNGRLLLRYDKEPSLQEWTESEKHWGV